MMKAITYSKYGPPMEVLEVNDVEKPSPKENEVLVKIHATAINDWDWSMVTGKPYLYRLLHGLFKPKKQISGMELSGVVEGLGQNANAFNVGDAVYGDTSEFGFGTYAEFICINEKALVLKPEKMTFAEAASLSHASLLALQGLRDIGNIQKGQKVLINGAGGGFGSLGLQLLKQYDAEVTGVDTGAKLERMKSIGFDHIIDYKKEDFTRNGRQYDLILDAKTNRSILAYSRSLKSKGIYVTVGGQLNKLVQLLVMKLFVPIFSKKKYHILGLKPNKGLDTINELYNEGKLKCVLDTSFAFEDIPKALQYFGDANHTGKIVVSIPQN